MSTGDRWELEEPIGRGGMATVWRARDTVAEMEVALKVLHEHLTDDEGVVEAFEREARLMRRIDHPGVVRILEVTDVEERPAIAMELCEGGVLSDRIDRRGSFPESEALDVLLPVMEALRAAHDRDIVHRDVKPHNVVFDLDDEPRLVDFGIGQAEELMAADDAGQLGTVEYMAPERADGLVVDARSDIYSLGVVLFELLCGHPPYRGDTAAEVIRMHREADVADPRMFADGISESVADTVVRATAKHPEDRFDTVEEMIEALEGDSEPDSPIEAHPGWAALDEELGGDTEMAAPLETEDHEWVVYVPDRARNLTGSIDADRIWEIIGEYEPDYATYDARPAAGAPGVPKITGSTVKKGVTYGILAFIRPDALIGDHETIRGLVDDSTDDEPRADRNETVEVLKSYGIARGLSHRGAEQLRDRLNDAGLMVRCARRPRSGRRESFWKQLATRPGTWSRAGLALGVVAVASAVAIYLLGPGTVPASLRFGLVAVVASLAGLFLAGTTTPRTIREWWTARMSTRYLLDFSAHRGLSRLEAGIGPRHYELFDDIESTRVASSYRRALEMVLHLRDRDVDGERVAGIVDGLTELAGEITELESRILAIRPGRVAGRIRQIDRRLEAEDDIEETQRLMDRKAELREQLSRRDAARQSLQRRAQRMHELASRLEALVRNHRRVGTSPDTDELTTLDFEIDDQAPGCEPETICCSISGGSASS